MHVFVLMAVKAFGQSYIQGLVTKFTASPPWGAVGHHPKRPLRCPRPGDKGQRSGKQLRGVPFRSHSFIIVVWNCNLVLEAKDGDRFITYPICIYA